MKKHAVMIQCHNNSEQVNSIIEFANGYNYDFYIHVDKKSNINEKIVKQNNVFFVDEDKRVDVRWGDYSQVEATLELLKSVRENKNEYQYVHLISGACFWAMHPNSIIKELETDTKQYIECHALPEDTTWTWGGESRYSVFYPKWMIERPTGNQLKRYSRIMWQEFVMRTKVFKRKKYPVKKFYGGSQWFSITGELADWMVDYVDKHPEYTKPFVHGILVDEVFFSTLAMYSPFRENVQNYHKRYMIWNIVKTGGPSVLTENDIVDIVKSGDFFARKILNATCINKLKEKIMLEEK